MYTLKYINTLTRHCRQWKRLCIVAGVFVLACVSAHERDGEQFYEQLHYGMFYQPPPPPTDQPNPATNDNEEPRIRHSHSLAPAAAPLSSIVEHNCERIACEAALTQ